MSYVDKYRKGLVCLVPSRVSMSDPDHWPITSHEKTLCDCKVLEIFAELDALRELLEEMRGALEYYKTTFDVGIKARQALAESE